MYDYRRSRPRWFSPTRLDGGHAVWSSGDEERGRDTQTKEKRERKGECVDYYFNTGLIWRTHKGRCAGEHGRNRRAISCGASIAARVLNIYSKYISRYPFFLSHSRTIPRALTHTHMYTYMHILSLNRRNGPLCGRSPRLLLPSRTLAHPLLSSPRCPGYTDDRGGVRTSRVYACHPRFTLAPRALDVGGVRGGRLYTRVGAHPHCR